MKPTTHTSALKKATLCAAIGTTLYTLFVPMLAVTFYDKIAWLNFHEHPWIHNAWLLFFKFILLLSWAIFALGIIRDGEHFPPINKWVRYALLVLAIGLILVILSSYWAWGGHPSIYPYIALMRCALSSIYSILLWYLYARTLSVNTLISSNDILIPSNDETASSVNQSVLSNATPSRSLRWSKCVCWIVFVFILALLLDYIAALADYAVGVLQHRSYYIDTVRQLWYWTNRKCNWLLYIIPLTFCLCLFLQPIINRRSNNKSATTFFKKATLISAIITGVPILLLLLLLLLESLIDHFVDTDLAGEMLLVFTPIAWMISCIVFSLGIIRDGEHFPPISKWVRYVLLIWTILFIGFFLLLFNPSEDIMPLVWFAGIVLCFHYMIWFWYLFKRTSSNTTVSRNSPWMKGIAIVTIVGVTVFTILTLLIVVYGITCNGDVSGELLDTSAIMYFLYVIVAPFTFSLCLFLQPMINRRSNKQLATALPRATDNSTDGDRQQTIGE